MTNLVWYFENIKLRQKMWPKHSPEEIAMCINDILSMKYQGRKIIWQTSIRGVLYKAKELKLIDEETLIRLDRQIKREKAKRRYIPEKIKIQVLSLDNYKCLLCGCAEDLSVDHILAIGKGGNNSIDNLQTLCRSCNSLKMLDTVNFRNLFERYKCESCNRLHYRNTCI